MGPACHPVCRCGRESDRPDRASPLDRDWNGLQRGGACGAVVRPSSDAITPSTLARPPPGGQSSMLYLPSFGSLVFLVIATRRCFEAISDLVPTPGTDR